MTLTIASLDATGQADTTRSGSVQLQLSDPQASVWAAGVGPSAATLLVGSPAGPRQTVPLSLSGGVASARVSFTHPGHQTALAITADQVAGEATIDVAPTLFALRPVSAAASVGAARAASAPVTAGVPAQFTLVAEDDAGVPVDGYSGDVVLSSDDAAAQISVPAASAPGIILAATSGSGGANYQFQTADHGAATLSVVFSRAGSHRLSVRDAASLTPLANLTVSVGAGASALTAPAAPSSSAPSVLPTSPSSGTSPTDASSPTPTPTPLVPPRRPHSDVVPMSVGSGATAARTNLRPSGVEETAARLSSPLPAAGAEEAGAATALGSGPSPLDQAQAQRTSLNRTSLSLTASPTTSAIGAAVSVTVTAMQNGTVFSTYAGTIEFTSSDPAFAPGTAYRYTFTGADAGVHTLP